ncbi:MULTISPECIES: hypothetical protein [unclassified Nocardioides]|uniref:hypothetical protein n=1 Tax=unclassified Nocardioides TaxID=2615069 RepID=UPI0006FBCD9F|nr:MULTISPECIES: hypothetical protein [unclassified Nocardioides]KRA38427.1 hypothetical protein ASD81_07280 [Nocardioides sp. Root614]KRA92386.1 hypothetical protein ASD84_07545 [Nocardioides sp. Root682]
MVLSRALRAAVATLTLTAAGIVGTVTSAAPAVPDTSSGAEPFLDSFHCSADPAHNIGVFLDGDTYRGNVNWVPEHFVAPTGAPWEVKYADGQVRLIAQGQYLPLPGQPFRRGTMTLTAQVSELHPTVTHTGTGTGSGASNDQEVHLTVARALEVMGTAHLEFDNGSTAEVSGCTGSVVSRTMDRQSEPKAQVRSASTSGAWCNPVEQGTRVDEVWIDTATEDWVVTLSTYDDAGTPDNFDDDSGAFYSSVTTVTLAQIEDGTSLELAGTNLQGDPVDATMTLAWSGATVSPSALLSGTWTQRSTITSGPLTGDVTDADGRVTALDCFAYSADHRRVDTGGGSPPTGPAPINDTPGGAVVLTGTATLQTSGSALEAEQANPCTEPWEDQPDYRATHTVWFAVTGDGPTTIDTAGTRFDTAIAVYVADEAGALVPVEDGCNDDWWRPLAPGLVTLTLQARSTFDAASGTTYYVQVGGVSSDENYGALRVAVRSGST